MFGKVLIRGVKTDVKVKSKSTIKRKVAIISGNIRTI